MSNKELVFYCTDFSPLEKDGKNNFRLKILGEDGKEIKTNRNLPKVISQLLSNDDDSEHKKKDILIKILNLIQQNIDRLLVDKKLEDEEKQIYTKFKDQFFLGGLVGIASIKNISLTDNKQNIVDITIQINTRFDDPDLSMDIPEGTELKPYFLMNMLLKGYMPLSNSSVRESKERLTDLLLLYAFVNKFKDAYVKGFFRAYQRFERNDSRVKGSIDVTRHIKLNAGQNNGKVAYSYREKTEVNYVNALVVEAYKHLKQKYYKETLRVFDKDIELKQVLEFLTYLTNTLNIPRKTVIMKNRNAIFHPYYTEYEDLRRVCIKVLRDEKISVFDGNKEQKVEGVLTYVPKLWEQCIEDCLRSISFKSQDKQYVFGVDNNTKYKQLTIPDYVFYNENGKAFMILDAKFKPGWMQVSTGQKKLEEEKLLSDYDKCIRDMVSINSHVTGVIFPTNHIISKYLEDGYIIDGQKYNYQHNISEFNSIDKFYTFPVCIPERSEGFEQWKQSFDVCNEELFKSIQTIVEEVESKALKNERN